MIITEIRKERITNMAVLREDTIIRYLKKYSNRNFNRYYEHATQILYKINGIPPPIMTPEMENSLKNMFKQIQEPFELYRPKRRNNFLSYSYILYKFCELLGYREFLSKFKLLKSKDHLYQMDTVWRKICVYLGGSEKGWEYRPTL